MTDLHYLIARLEAEGPEQSQPPLPAYEGKRLRPLRARAALAEETGDNG